MDHDAHAMQAHHSLGHGHDHAGTAILAQAGDRAARSSAPTSARVAFTATLHCLAGCAIGEVLGMVIGTALGLDNVSTIVLAFFFGYLLTMLPLLRAGMPRRTAVKLALAADTVSITLMEIVDNAIMWVIPGAMDAGLDTLLFWGSLAFALVVAGLAAWPVNYWLIARGRGHAVVHGHHAH